MDTKCKKCKNIIPLTNAQYQKLEKAKGYELILKCTYCNELLACQLKKNRIICQIISEQVGIFSVYICVSMLGTIICFYSIIEKQTLWKWNDILLSICLGFIGLLSLFISIYFFLVFPYPGRMRKRK